MKSLSSVIKVLKSKIVLLLLIVIISYSIIIVIVLMLNIHNNDNLMPKVKCKSFNGFSFFKM